MAANDYLFDVIALLLAAVAVVPVLQRLGIPSVLGYLAAGVVLGPYTPGPVVDLEATRPLAEFGVVFLLFAIGLELPLARLWTMRRFIFGLGLLQVAVTGAIFGGLAVLMGLKPQMAVVVGATLAFSSTATALAIMVERNEAVTHHGRIAVSVLIFQDLAVVPVLALLPLLAGDSRRIAEALSLAGLKAGVAVAAIYLLGRLVIRPAYRYLSATRNPEVFMAANLLLVLAVAVLTAEAGMSMALGAFLAGLLLADSPYRHQVEADIEPFRGLLLGLFFMTVGMSINLPVVFAQAWAVLGLAVLCLVVKAGVIAVLCRILGLGWTEGMQVGLLLGQIGEFAFVVFGKAMELGLLGSRYGQTLIAAVALSMVLTPAVVALGRRLVLRRQGAPAAVAAPGTERLAGHVVIAGYGRVGRAIARMLGEHGIAWVALDLDAERIARAQAHRLPVYFGDASQPGVLRSIGIARARAAVITINRPRTVEQAVTVLRQTVPDLTIVARAHDRRQEAVLGLAGASAVVPETMEASLQMAGLVLRSVGIPSGEVDSSISAHRRRHYGNLHSGETEDRRAQ
jgi:CPA2 family monovalent cation:H+ antiporter-2